MSVPPDHESRPELNWVYYRALDGSMQKFNLNREVRLHGYWRSRPDDDPPSEVMYRVSWRLYVLHGVLDPAPRQVTPIEARAWLEARQAFSLGKPDESLYAKMPPDLLALEDPATAEAPTAPGRGRRGRTRGVNKIDMALTEVVAQLKCNGPVNIPAIARMVRCDPRNLRRSRRFMKHYNLLVGADARVRSGTMEDGVADAADYDEDSAGISENPPEGAF
jgi:hypothetical protein